MNIMPFESGGERISTKQRMLMMSLCSEKYNMTFFKSLSLSYNSLNLKIHSSFKLYYLSQWQLLPKLFRIQK